MRFPWQQRADDAKRERLDAERRLAEVRRDWPVVREHADELREQRELNGWTGIVNDLFARR